MGTVFTDDWGQKQRRIAIEINETPEGVHLEVTLLINGQRIPMIDATEDQLNDHLPLLLFAKKMNDDLSDKIEKLSEEEEAAE